MNYDWKYHSGVHLVNGAYRCYEDKETGALKFMYTRKNRVEQWGKTKIWFQLPMGTKKFKSEAELFTALKDIDHEGNYYTQMIREDFEEEK